jgi:N-hydroxyarylamine O-acetyltransferase
MGTERTRILTAYLDRVGVVPGPPRADLLRELVGRHVATFAFASIGPRLGDALPLDEPSLVDRIVVRRRGGYCFEQNGLFFAVLDELGFQPRLVLARVLHEEGSHPPLTHRISIVSIDGVDHLVDVGFGAQGPPVPVPLHGGRPGVDQHWVEEGEPGELHLRTMRDGVPVSLYRFELSRYGPSDCELGHFYSHRHPDAFFVNTLVASRILPGEVRTLRNRDVRVVRPTGTTERVIRDGDDLRATLADMFDLDVTPEEGRRLFAELPADSDT